MRKVIANAPTRERAHARMPRTKPVMSKYFSKKQSELTNTFLAATLVAQAMSVLAPAFEQNPVIAYMLNSMTPEQCFAYLPRYFDCILNGATTTPVSDWQSCRVNLPPGAEIDNPLTLLPAGLLRVLWSLGVSGCRKTLVEWPSLTEPIKKREVDGGKEFYYVFCDGTAQAGRGLGLSQSCKYYDSGSCKTSHWWASFFHLIERLLALVARICCFRRLPKPSWTAEAVGYVCLYLQ